MNRSVLVLLLVAVMLSSCQQKKQAQSSESKENLASYQESFRPQYHFTPESNWMNDPNGLVYENGTYHLFYQYYPEDIVWGPMHWGHAVSKDLISWEHLPIALFPDELGYIFSGSAVLDQENSSGLGSEEHPPLIAVYTYHDPKGAEEGAADFQYQGLAYSLDHGLSWKKYHKNPIIPNTNDLKDFRDPKVVWNTQLQAWTIALVAGDHLQLWKSNNLLNWEFLSEFGRDQGAQGGVWECPDIFEMEIEGSQQKKWVVLISINPGAPNGGSGTQYFVGDFDGTTFTTDQKTTKWIDLGTDNYAGVTYNGTEGQRLFIGWMSNWSYALKTPTKKWRSAMTLPRALSLTSVNGDYVLSSYPVEAVQSIVDQQGERSFEVPTKASKTISHHSLSQSKIAFKANNSFDLKLQNKKGEVLLISVSNPTARIEIDRSNSGVVDFSEQFFSVMEADFKNQTQNEFELFIDKSSLELFVNKGARVMTLRVFNTEDFESLEFENTSDTVLEVNALSISPIRGIWN